MNYDEFKAETQEIGERTKSIFNALVTVTEKHPRTAVWLGLALLLALLVLAIREAFP